MNKIILALLIPIAISSCGDNKTGPDAKQRDAPPDGGFPAAPALGAQIERMGRPAINTALNALLEVGAPATAKKNATWSLGPANSGMVKR